MSTPERTKKYFITQDGIEREVTLVEWVCIERASGFGHSYCWKCTSSPCTHPATGGFTSWTGTQGRIEYS